MLKKILLFVFLLSLSNCATSGSALLGPIFTGAKTGSAYQTSLSYGSSKIINQLNPLITETETQKTIVKSNIKFPDIPYSDKDPIILAFYKVDKITFSEIVEPEPLP